MDGSLVFLVHVYDISIECSHTRQDYSVYDVDQVRRQGIEDTHAHTQTHPWWSIKARAYNDLDAPQAVPNTYVIAGIDMRANADLWGGKGERKELPGHRPGRPEARASASRAAIGQRSGRAGARISTIPGLDGTPGRSNRTAARLPAASKAASPANSYPLPASVQLSASTCQLRRCQRTP